jgi:ParB family chromosome partitioning protein
VRAGSARELPLSAISVNPRQPRESFDEAAIADLAASIATHGVLQPILVRTSTRGGFELIAGERRLRAAKAAGLTSIPALVKEVGEDDSLVLAIVENIQRSDLLGPRRKRARIAS